MTILKLNWLETEFNLKPESEKNHTVVKAICKRPVSIAKISVRQAVLNDTIYNRNKIQHLQQEQYYGNKRRDFKDYRRTE